MAPIQVYRDGDSPKTPWLCTKLHPTAASMTLDLPRISRIVPPPIGTEWAVIRGPIRCLCCDENRQHYTLNAEPLPRPRRMVATRHGTFAIVGP